MALKQQKGSTAPDGSIYVTLTTGSGDLVGAGAASSIAVGTTTISGGANNQVLFDNAGVIGELATTGTGNVVRATSPTLVTPVLGTPTSGTLTNCTGLPVGGVTGLSAGMGTFLATPSSANLLATMTDETGTGACVFATNPTLTTPTINTPTLSVPYFVATLTAAQSLTSGALTKVTFNSEVSDSHNWYDPTTNFRFTPQKAGRYRITTGSFANVSGGGITAYNLIIQKNGTVMAQSLVNFGSPIAANYGPSLSKIISFNGTTDFVEVFAQVTFTGTLQLLNGEGNSYFEGNYIAT